MDELQAYTPIQFPPLELFFMRLPSLIFASLVISSSSLSALAAPVGTGAEGSSFVLPALQHAPIPFCSDDTIIAQPNSERPSCNHHTFLSNTATNHLQTGNLVDKVAARQNAAGNGAGSNGNGVDNNPVPRPP